MLLFLFAMLVGLVVPRFAIPRLGLSTHLLGIMQGIFLMVLGQIWPRLRLVPVLSRIGFVLATYGSFTAWTANLSAAIWGAGGSMLPIAAGAARGSSFQETMIAIALRSAAMSVIAVALLVSWGLMRGSPDATPARVP